MEKIIKSKAMKPILKYPGGKIKELPIINEYIPQTFQDYYEPFVGGGSIWLNLHAEHYYVNDLSNDLMGLYGLLKHKDIKFIKIIKDIIHAWKMPYIYDLISKYPDVLVDKAEVIDNFEQGILPHLYRDMCFVIPNKEMIMKQLNKSVQIKVQSMQRMKTKYGKVTGLDTNAVTAIKSTVYTLLRRVYNHTSDYIVRIATYWYLREYAYSSMFRFNKHGEFNVPYGGASYNHKSLLPKLREATSEGFQAKLQDTVLFNDDFYDALQHATPTTNDFMFLDPPYDTSFSTYDQNAFGQDKQRELAQYLKGKVHAKFMLVIKSSKLINTLYKDGEPVQGGGQSLHIIKFDKHYQVSFQGRNEQDAHHLLITNY